MCSLFYLRHLDKLQVETDNRRFHSYLLADELRQTSDDLTKMVRLYVMTKDKKYKKSFFDILKIREGEIKRPANYHQIYWDLVHFSDKPFPLEDKRSLKKEMIRQKFTIEEFNLLIDAKSESDDLVKMEMSAIHAIEGKYDDGTSTYQIQGQTDQELAQKLVFGTAYMEAKARIMTPIQTFLTMVEERTKLESINLNKRFKNALIVSISIAILATLIMIISIVKTLTHLSKLNKENEKLLLNILPTPIANRLKEGEKIIADKYPQVSVLFADIVNFTEMTNTLGPSNIVKILNDVFARFDHITEQYGIEKIKTIGDNYMAVAGVPNADTNHAVNLANFALAMREVIEQYNQENQMELKIRIGMSYGSVIAGVIGEKKFVYDLWGDGVNIASRMETTGIEGKIHVSEKMKMLLEESFAFEQREEIEVKGVGKMMTYFLTGRKDKQKLPENSSKE